MSTPTNETVTDCRSEEGVTVGLIDAMISIAHVVAKRNLSPHAVQEAIKDWQQDEDVRRLFGVSLLDLEVDRIMARACSLPIGDEDDEDDEKDPPYSFED